MPLRLPVPPRLPVPLWLPGPLRPSTHPRLAQQLRLPIPRAGGPEPAGQSAAGPPAAGAGGHDLLVSGLRLHVRDSGPGHPDHPGPPSGIATGTLPPVLLLTENAAGGAGWAAVVHNLLPLHRCVLPDLPGTGRSERPPTPLTEDAVVSLLADLADLLGLRAAVVATAEPQCPLGPALAARRPDLVSALLWCDSPSLAAPRRSALTPRWSALARPRAATRGAAHAPHGPDAPDPARHLAGGEPGGLPRLVLSATAGAPATPTAAAPVTAAGAAGAGAARLAVHGATPLLQSRPDRVAEEISALATEVALRPTGTVPAV